MPEQNCIKIDDSLSLCANVSNGYLSVTIKDEDGLSHLAASESLLESLPYCGQTVYADCTPPLLLKDNPSSLWVRVRDCYCPKDVDLKRKDIMGVLHITSKDIDEAKSSFIDQREDFVSFAKNVDKYAKNAGSFSSRDNFYKLINGYCEDTSPVIGSLNPFCIRQLVGLAMDAPCLVDKALHAHSKKYGSGSYFDSQCKSSKRP